MLVVGSQAITEDLRARSALVPALLFKVIFHYPSPFGNNIIAGWSYMAIHGRGDNYGKDATSIFSTDAHDFDSDFYQPAGQS